MTTQFARASYQEIIDLSTQPEAVSVIGIHTPNTSTPVEMLHGFWDQFRQFRYEGCSISLVPSATLPSDISQVSYEAGEAPIDPRDILNPVMFHGCHGEDMGSILNGFLGDCSYAVANGWTRQNGDSANIWHREGTDTDFAGQMVPSPLESLYYKALTDKSWKKAHPQRGFRKSGLRPMVYNVVTNTPYGSVVPGTDAGYYGPEGYLNAGDVLEGHTPGVGTGTTDAYPNQGEMGRGGATDVGSFVGARSRAGLPSIADGKVTVPVNARSVGFMTNKLVPLGWRDTKSLLPNTNTSPYFEKTYVETPVPQIGENLAMSEAYSADAFDTYHTVDKLFMGLILLPPSYKARQYMRLIINHRFSFRRFRGASMDTSTPRSVAYAEGYHNLL